MLVHVVFLVFALGRLVRVQFLSAITFLKITPEQAVLFIRFKLKLAKFKQSGAAECFPESAWPFSGIGGNKVVLSCC